MKYIIEHMDEKMPKWSILEYRHISSIVGKKSLFFTNVRHNADKIKKLGKVFSKSVSELNFSRICLLDMNAKNALTTKDRDNFDFFAFGGILGDNPPQKRTQKLLNKLKNAQTRHLGKEQMSTDTAVFVTKMILDGKKLKEIRFTDTILIPLRKGEDIIFPFRYVLKDKKIMLTPGLIKLLKKQKGF